MEIQREPKEFNVLPNKHLGQSSELVGHQCRGELPDFFRKHSEEWFEHALHEGWVMMY